MNKNEKLSELLAALGLKIDTSQIVQEVKARGFTGASIVSISLATAGLMEINPDLTLDQAITEAQDYLLSNYQVITRKINIFEEPDNEQ